MSGDQYDEAYFLRGRESGKSLYENYRWLPDLTIPMARRIIEHCRIEPEASVLDYGCARGYLVRALRECGMLGYGYDLSSWATENADPAVIHYVTHEARTAFNPEAEYHWIIAKDVLEHVEYVDHTINHLLSVAQVGLFVVVPLSQYDGEKYVIEEYEKDVTHVQRCTLTTWMKKFIRVGWSVEGAYRLPGIKDNYYKPGWELGNGFITVRRVLEP